MPSNSIFRFLKFCTGFKKNNFSEFKVHFICRKQVVPLLHNTVLILCHEGPGLVTVFPGKLMNQKCCFLGPINPFELTLTVCFGLSLSSGICELQK